MVNSESIVLRVQKHGETSKIVTLYTRDFGKLNVIAKGAREMKSKFGGALEAFTVSNAFIYKKDRPGLYLLAKADVIRSNARILQSLDRIEAGMSMVELVLRAMHDEEQNTALFELLSSALDALGKTESDASADVLLIWFYLHFAHASGYQLKLQEDEADRLSESARNLETRWLFRVRTGEMVEIVISTGDGNLIHDLQREQIAHDAIPVTGEVRSALVYLENAPITKVEALRLSPHAVTSMLDLFRAYFVEHVSGITPRSLKSNRVMSGL